MTITIKTSATSTTGYEIVDGDKTLPIDKFYPGEPTTLVLPANSANRKYFSSKKVDEAGGEIEVEYKEAKKFGPRTSSGEPRVVNPLENYLSDDKLVITIQHADGTEKTEELSLRELYLQLTEKAKTARAEANKPKPMTELEKAQKAAEQAKAKYEALLAKVGK